MDANCRYCGQPFAYERKSGRAPAYCCDQHRWKAAREAQNARRREASERRCSRCKATKPSAEFSGPSAPYCKPCTAAWARENRAENGRDPEYTRRERLRGYGLTPEQFDAMLAAQGGRCAICRTDEPAGLGWHIDHDHSCCKRKRGCERCRRGILCTRCNIGIGNLRDDPVVIAQALDYVTAHKARLAAALPAA